MQKNSNPICEDTTIRDVIYVGLVPVGTDDTNKRRKEEIQVHHSPSAHVEKGGEILGIVCQ